MSDHQLSPTLEKPQLDPDGDSTTCQVDIDVDAGGRTENLPLDIVFCIDVSGSMKSIMGTSKLDHAKQGTIQAIEKLEPDDSFAVVAFGSRSDTLLPPTSDGASPGVVDDIEHISERTNAGGGTDITAGVTESKRLFSRMPSRESVQWVVLLTDGQDGSYDASETGSELASDGLTAHAVGLGNYDEEAVRVTAEQTQGNWRNAESASDIPNYFEGWVDDARGVVATTPELVVSPDHARVAEDVYYTIGGGQISEAETSRQSGTVRVDLADLRHDSPPTVLLHLDVPPHDPIPDVSLLELRLEIGGQSITETLTGDFTVASLRDPDSQQEEIRTKYALAKVGREALSGDPQAAIRQLEAEDVDDEVLDTAIQVLEGVDSGDKEAKEDASRLQSLALPDDE